MSKIGIIGIGTVGKSLAMSLTIKNYIPGKNLFLYDKYNKDFNDIDKMPQTNLLFLCLPTPFIKEKKCFDKSAIEEYLSTLSELKYTGTVIIKSTVEPGTTDKYSELYESLNIIYSPEFLREKFAVEDIENAKHVIFGVGKNSNSKNVCSFYRKKYPKQTIIKVSYKEAETMKITENSFAAVKLQFFNEVYVLCEKLKINYKKVINLLILNEKMTPNHTNVPGDDGKLSYGGSCLPKDTNALLELMKKNKVINSVLSATIEERDLMRTD